MKKFNLNEFIKFRLNDRGKDIFYHQYDELNKWLESNGAKPLERLFPAVDEDGYTEFQLWHFMNIYGPHMANGAPAFWEDANIYIKDEDLKNVEE